MFILICVYNIIVYYNYVHTISSCKYLKTVLVDNLPEMVRIGKSFRINMHLYTVEEHYLVSLVSHFSWV